MENVWQTINLRRQRLINKIKNYFVNQNLLYDEFQNDDEIFLKVSKSKCQKCPFNQVFVTNLCQGCLARPCMSTCKFGAISFKKGFSYIDQSKCKKCQMCIKVCPYNAIVKRTAPCIQVCPVNAIYKNENDFAQINKDKCINCGRCINNCPFGAIIEKTQIFDVLKNIEENKNVIAMFSPSTVSQFDCSIYQLKTGLQKLGFKEVYEVAQGAEITAKVESAEFVERMNNGDKFMTTSCCAGYRQLVKKHLPEIEQYVSQASSPMYYISEIVKSKNPDSTTVFISPCLAKKIEAFENKNVDLVVSIEELACWFVAKNIDLKNCEESYFDRDSSNFARNFGISGGVTEAVKSELNQNIDIKPFVINGLDKDSIKKLKEFAKNGVCENDCNLIEVMCCFGGCVGGNEIINIESYKIKH